MDFKASTAVLTQIALQKNTLLKIFVETTDFGARITTALHEESSSLQSTAYALRQIMKYLRKLIVFRIFGIHG